MANQDELLTSAVEEFESRFELVDDHYMHHPQERIAEGYRFASICSGEPGQAFSSSAEAVAAWLASATAYAVRHRGTEYMAWKARPHLVSVSGGVTVSSSLCIPPERSLSDETRARLAADGVEGKAPKVEKKTKGKKVKPEPVIPEEPVADGEADPK